MARYPTSRADRIAQDIARQKNAEFLAKQSKNDKDAERYRKLRRWMSSNVVEGWTQVEQLAAIACYVDWDAFDQVLDALPECNFGLCEMRAAVEKS